MLCVQDLDAAIAECLATDKPTKNTCLYLAAFQAVKDYFFSENMVEIEPQRMMSFSAAPMPLLNSGSEFAEAFNAAPTEALAVVDEILDTLSVTNPALYRSAMRKLREL